ncbi:MAG: nitroreductase family deazaflavin-dependent oxidoreductase [Candidatus Dormibacter sp.]
MTRRLLILPTCLYHHGYGWLLGHRFIMLTHVGRRTGRVFDTVLEVVALNDRTHEVVVVAGLGRSANWYRNIHAQPPRAVMIGRERFCPIVRDLDDEEASTVLAEYEQRNRWIRPVIRVVLSRLVGWRYDGSDWARRRLVRQLPFVAFALTAPGTVVHPIP